MVPNASVRGPWCIRSTATAESRLSTLAMSATVSTPPATAAHGRSATPASFLQLFAAGQPPEAAATMAAAILATSSGPVTNGGMV